MACAKETETGWLGFFRTIRNREIIRDILNATYPDRVIGIVGAAFVEDRLGQRIQTRLRYDQDVTPRLFKGSGALAAFGIKVDLGFLLGLYGIEMRDNLHIVRKIRNEFAHEAKDRTFATPPIQDLCGHLTIMRRFAHPENPDWFAGGMPTVHEAMITPPIGTRLPKEPREIYVTALQILLGYLHFTPDHPAPKPEF